MSIRAYRPNPLTREGQRYIALQERYQNTVLKLTNAETRERRLRRALLKILGHCDTNPQGETAFERSVIEAWAVMRGDPPQGDKP